MPVRRGKDTNGTFYRFGSQGAKYYYAPGNQQSRKNAKAKAARQGRAIKAGGR